MFDTIGDSTGGTFNTEGYNELWRASIAVLDSLTIEAVNYSGGIISADGYSEKKNKNECNTIIW